MKRILFLLLLTVSVYGQNPSRFVKIQITGNANSGTATKVNVQEANGEVNTQTINTGFNKNIGLGGSDVVGANTLLNQYSTTPVDWTATVFNSGQVVFYGGKQWIAKMATVAGDVPSVSSKWEEITFEALANKTTTVDQTIIDGSTNSVSGNAVFDVLALKSNLSDITMQRAYDTSTDKKIQTLAISPFTLKAQTAAASDNVFVIENSNGFEVASVGAQGKLSAISASVEGNVTGNFFIKRSTPANNILLAGGGDIAQGTFAPISSVHNPVTLGTANGLSLSTQQISLGLASSGVTGALSGTDWNTFNGKFNTPTGLTTNYLPKWNGSGFRNSQIFDNGTNIGIGTILPSSKFEVNSGDIKMSQVIGLPNTAGYGLTFRNVFNSNIYDAQIVCRTNAGGAATSGLLFRTGYFNGSIATQADRMYIDAETGNVLIGTTTDNLVSKLQVNGNITASPATTANQVVVKSQLDAVAARPYKVYTALLTQTGTNAPIATVLENTLGGTIVWSRTGVGTYTGTLTGAFVANKTIGFQGGNLTAPNSMVRITTGINNIQITTNTSTATADNLLGFTSIEIRVYN